MGRVDRSHCSGKRPLGLSMSTLLRDSGIILRNIPHGETSCILAVFMREHGRVGLMVKGARAKKKTGTAAALEPLTRVHFVYYHKTSRELQLAKEWTIEAPWLHIRSRLESLAVASAVIELLARCTKDEDPHPALYDAALEALLLLDTLPAGRFALLWKFALILFSELGFRLGLERCGESREKLQPPFTAPLRYRLQDGAFFAPLVNKQMARDGALSPEAFALLASLEHASWQYCSRIATQARIEFELTSFLASYLEAHLPVNGKLHSLAALRW